MDLNDRRPNELKESADYYATLADLAEQLKDDYRELSRKYKEQTDLLADMNSQLSEAVTANGQLSAYLNNILEHIDAGVIIMDKEGRISLFNQAAESLTGVSRVKAEGRDYRRIFGEDEHAPTHDLLKGSGHKVRGEKWFANQPVGYSSNKIFNKDGELCGVVEILYDISAEKNLRETIRHVSALAAVGEMAATVAHQVRNPLAAIIGFTDLLKRDLENNNQSTKIIDKIGRASNELSRIITSLLDYTKKTEPDFRELDIIKYIRETMESLAKEPYAKGIRFESDIKIKTLVYYFDPFLISQALTNLVHNSCQAMKPGAGILKMTVKTTDGNFLEIAFTDNGCGISEANIEDLFKPFYTTRSNGVGLGLSMVKKAIDFHNGIVTAYNRDDGGAVFVIKLPL
jgi:PAS domain S-box-containing protein